MLIVHFLSACDRLLWATMLVFLLSPLSLSAVLSDAGQDDHATTFYQSETLIVQDIQFSKAQQILMIGTFCVCLLIVIVGGIITYLCRRKNLEAKGTRIEDGGVIDSMAAETL
jgi:hypothetical protein